MRVTICLAFLLASSLAYARPKPARVGKGAPAKTVKSSKESEPATAPITKPLDPKVLAKSSAELLSLAKSLYDELEYEQVIGVAKAVLEHDDLSLEDKVEVYRLYASSLVVTHDPLEGARLFRALVRARPDYELPPKTPVKISQVFGQVKREEATLALNAERMQRDVTVKNLSLLGNPPNQAQGGKPLPFSFRLKDPTNAVEKIEVAYRRAGTSNYSTLPLAREEDGRWLGQIPADFTSDPKGFQLQYFVETSDKKGALLKLGAEESPLLAVVKAGTIESVRPPPVPRGVFVAGVGLTLASAASAVIFGILFNVEQNRFRHLSGEIPGTQLMATTNRGSAWASATNASLIALAVSLLGTGTLTPFVNWHPG